MFGRRVTLFRLAGFKVRLDSSWIVIAALVTWSLAAGLFPAAYPGLARAHYWWMGLAGAAGFFISIVLHELSHSLVARHFHLPMHGITLFLFGGVAEMGEEPRSPKVEFLMALAGPVASIALGFAFRLVALAGRAAWPIQVVGVFAYLSWINWALAAFNLIPAFPLDGGRMLRAALWHFQGHLTRATRIAAAIGSVFGMLLMAFGLYQLLSGHFIGAVWYFMIGTFLRNASRVSYQQVVLRSALEGETVRRFMHPNPVAVAPEMPLRQLVEDYIYRYDYKVYPVVEPGTDDLVGCVATRDVRRVPKEQWDQHHVAEVATACSPENTITPETGALEALAKIQQNEGNSLLVTDHHHLLATVSASDVMRFLAARMELEGGPMGLLPAGRH
jgi:Zn-dependent protease/CBS domain-containing protein